VRVYGLELGVNEYIKFGNSQEFQMYFDGTNCKILATSGNLNLLVNTNELAVSCVPNAEVDIYYNNSARFRSASTGVQFSANGSDWSGILEDNEASPSGTDVLGYNGYFYATRVYNAVWNDIADCRKLRATAKETPGKCYVEDGGAATTPTKRCQKGVLGVLSDTYGFGVGAYNGHKPFAIAGWVLSFVDKEYQPGTCLTNDKDGNLTKMKWWEKVLFPERIVATYCNKETAEMWGDEDDKVKVNGRHWVKVK
jgi:hypothetical protein